MERDAFPQPAGKIHPNEPMPVPVEWGQVVTDPRLVAAIVDRVTFNGHIIETGTESFRLATTRAKRTRGKAT
jgi:hypothetical protein